MKKIVLLCFVLVLLSTLAFNIQPVESDWTWTETIYIKADGSIEPSTAPIQRNGNIYTLTDNIIVPPGSVPYAILRIERDNIVLDGAGYTVQHSGSFIGSIGEGWVPIPKGVLLLERSNVTIKNMKITDALYGIWFSGSSNNSIVGNSITASRSWGIYLSGSSNNTISGNNITNNGQGIKLQESSNNTISGNNVTDNNGWYALNLSGSSNNSISNNSFVNDGLFVSGSYGNVVENNLVNGKPLVYLEGASDYIVENAGQVILVNCNGIRVENLNLSNTEVGVELWRTNNTIIAENNVTNNNFGIWQQSSNHNRVSGNRILGNSECGIWLSGSSNNSIVGNTITANKNFGGMHLTQSSNNSIYHNTFADNQFQVYIHPSEDLVNIWDDGYPSGGNFWSDYPGVDADGDNIGDTPYVIDENNQDNYPLMNPVVIPEFPDEENSIPTTEPFPTWIVAAIVIIVVVGAALLVYFRKIRKTTEKAE